MLLGRTRIAAFSAVFALAIPTIVVILVGADVAQVEDQGEIPRGIPRPGWPDLSAFSWSLLAGAMAVAAIVLVQGVGVAESAPNDDGTRSNSNVDFIAQGVGNLGSGFFKGQPVGGSVGQTALNRTAGARTRWASIYSGLWMLMILALFSGVVGVVAMPTLAALLIYAAAGSLRFLADLRDLAYRTDVADRDHHHLRRHAPAPCRLSRRSRGCAVATAPAQPVGARPQGGRDRARRRRTTGGTPGTDSDWRVTPSRSSTSTAASTTPAHEPSNTTFPTRPAPIRPRLSCACAAAQLVGATVFAVLTGYAEQLDAVGGRLYLAGLEPTLIAQAQRNGTVTDGGPVRLYEATRRDRRVQSQTRTTTPKRG